MSATVDTTHDDALSAAPRARGRRPGNRYLQEANRARMLAAATQAVAQVGYGELTVDHVIARAGVSRRQFYAMFDDCEHCFLETFNDALSRIAVALGEVDDASATWDEQLRSTVAAILCLLDDEPEVARLCIVEALRAGPAVLRRRAEVIGELARALEAMYASDPSAGGASPPPLITEAAVGGALSMLHDRLVQRSRSPLFELLSPVMAVLVSPYVDRATAARQLRRRAARPRSRPRMDLAAPAAALDIRLTGRTVEVIRYVGRHPASSNRDIAVHCGRLDQGQISRMLRRLAAAGVIENVAQRRAKGLPNAWSLTGEGEELRRTIER